MYIDFGVILAAGRGTRMGDKTLETPKALLPSAEDSLLGRQLDFLRPFVKTLIVTTGYLGHLVEKVAHLNGADLTINTLGQGNAFFLQSPLMNEAIGKKVIVITCDNIMNYNVSTLIEFDKELPAGITLVTKTNGSNLPGDRITVGNGFSVTGIGKYIDSPKLASGLQILDFDLAKSVGADDFTEIWNFALRKARLRVSPSEPTFWEAFDTPESLERFPKR